MRLFRFDFVEFVVLCLFTICLVFLVLGNDYDCLVFLCLIGWLGIDSLLGVVGLICLLFACVGAHLVDWLIVWFVLFLVSWIVLWCI